jgi:hypothetical protein
MLVSWPLKRSCWTYFETNSPSCSCRCSLAPGRHFRRHHTRREYHWMARPASCKTAMRLTMPNTQRLRSISISYFGLHEVPYVWLFSFSRTRSSSLPSAQSSNFTFHLCWMSNSSNDEMFWLNFLVGICPEAIGFQEQLWLSHRLNSFGSQWLCRTSQGSCLLKMTTRHNGKEMLWRDKKVHLLNFEHDIITCNIEVTFCIGTAFTTSYQQLNTCVFQFGFAWGWVVAIRFQEPVTEWLPESRWLKLTASTLKLSVIRNEFYTQNILDLHDITASQHLY